MTQLLVLALQGLILTLAIFLFLRLVRSSRGGRLVRGLVIALLVGIVGLWLLAESLGLEELQVLLNRSVQVLAVLFVVLFQPELRRGIAQLGGAGVLWKLLKTIGKDATSEVARACAAMASRKHGAIVAFERENPLDPYVEGGVQLDSEVAHLLLESIFHPGGKLHDGAVVVRGDRVAAACCLFPLTENLELARSTGTRHRAALGLTDETDAVTVVVSEETGKVSLCKRGEIREVPLSKLEDVLREEVGRRDDTKVEPAAQRSERVRRFFRHDLLWLVSSGILATAILYAARQSLLDDIRIPLHATVVTEDEVRPAVSGELLLVLPSADWALVESSLGDELALLVHGSQGQLVSEGVRSLGGMLTLKDPETSVGVDDVAWSYDEGVDLRWANGEDPLVLIEELVTETIELDATRVSVDVRDAHPYYEAQPGAVTFSAPEVEVRGPLADVERPRGAGADTFRPIQIRKQDDRQRVATLALSDELLAAGFELVGAPVTATVPVLPAPRDLGPIQVTLILECGDPTRQHERAHFSIPLDRLETTVRVHTAGLISPTASPELLEESTRTIEDYVSRNLIVLVDIRETSPPDTLTARIRTRGIENWREELLLPNLAEIPETARLEVEVDGAEEPVRLLHEVPDESPPLE